MYSLQGSDTQGQRRPLLTSVSEVCGRAGSLAHSHLRLGLMAPETPFSLTSVVQSTQFLFLSAHVWSAGRKE